MTSLAFVGLVAALIGLARGGSSPLVGPWSDQRERRTTRQDPWWPA